MRLIAHDGNDPRGAAEQFDFWCAEHTRPWYEDHLYMDASMVARDLCETIDINAPLPSDVICAAAAQDPSMFPVVGPYLTMVTLPASLKQIEESARAVLRSGWRPPIADGPSAAALAEGDREHAFANQDGRDQPYGHSGALMTRFPLSDRFLAAFAA